MNCKSGKKNWGFKPLNPLGNSRAGTGSQGASCRNPRDSPVGHPPKSGVQHLFRKIVDQKRMWKTDVKKWWRNWVGKHQNMMEKKTLSLSSVYLKNGGSSISCLSHPLTTFLARERCAFKGWTVCLPILFFQHFKEWRWIKPTSHLLKSLCCQIDGHS